VEELLYLGEEHELCELPGDDEGSGEGGNGGLVQQARNRLSQGDTHCQNLQSEKDKFNGKKPQKDVKRNRSPYRTASKMKF
jgi:hypothetical protein